MPESKKYVTAVGFVQFDPQEREANGKNITDVVIKSTGGDGKFIRITVWPELLLEQSLGRKIKKGDFVGVDGAFTSNVFQDKATGANRTGLNISAYQLNVNGTPIERQEREVEVANELPETSDEDTF